MPAQDEFSRSVSDYLSSLEGSRDPFLTLSYGKGKNKSTKDVFNTSSLSESLSLNSNIRAVKPPRNPSRFGEGGRLTSSRSNRAAAQHSKTVRQVNPNASN